MSPAPCLMPLAPGLSPPGWSDLYLLVGGTALFLLGVQMASDSLRRLAGGRMRAVFALASRSRLAGAGAGFTVTAMLQSSSASSVVLMGMADAGLLTAAESGAMLLGAGVGTTLVPQILAFRVARWGLVLVAAGLAVQFAVRWQVWKSAGSAVVGFGLLFFGMDVMGQSVEFLRGDPRTAETLRALAGNPWLGFLAAAALTGAIQSSGATVAMAMTLAVREASPGVPVLSLEAALPVVIGANVGTCVTGVIAAVGAGHEGRRVAAVHLGYKLLAALAVMPLVVWTGLGGAAMELCAAGGAGPERAVANAHTLFNVVMALAFLPFCAPLAGLIGRLVPRRSSAAELAVRDLGAKLGGEPAAAIMAAESVLVEMGRRCARMLRGALEALERGGSVRIEEVRRCDDEVDALYAALGQRLAGMSPARLSAADSERRMRVLYLARLFEAVGDLVSRELTEMAAKRARDDVAFSMESLAALRRFGAAALRDLERVAAAADREGAPEVAKVVAGPEIFDREAREIVASHFRQVCRGVAEAGESGAILPDTVAALREVRRTVAEIAAVLAEAPGAPPAAGG